MLLEFSVIIWLLITLYSVFIFCNSSSHAGVIECKYTDYSIRLSGCLRGFCSLLLYVVPVA